MYSEFLIHLDTLGTDSDAVIIGLGGIAFSLENKDVVPHYRYWPVSAGSNRRRSIDPEVVEFWQSAPPYLDPFTRDDIYGLSTALEEFVAFYDGVMGERVWTWTHHIEGTILQTAFEALKITCPWPYYALWEGKTFCRTCEEYTPTRALPTPSGTSPEDQMKRRMQAICTAHRYFTACAEKQEHVA